MYFVLHACFPGPEGSILMLMEHFHNRFFGSGRLVVLLSLLTLTAALGSAQAPAPEEARGFAGEGLHLYPLGWSSEGRWGGLIASLDSGGEGHITLLIIDAVTDEVLFRSKPMEWSGSGGFNDFWARYGRSVSEKADSFDLESARRPDVRDARFITGSITYEFLMDPPSPATGIYSLRISSSRGDIKDVYRSSEESYPAGSVLLGALVSPFEARALAIIRESSPSGIGNPSYHFSGAHLTLGFSSLYTAVKPDPSGGSILSAIFNGQVYLLRSRLESGADPDVLDERAYSALLVAARLGHWEMVLLLLEAGSSPLARDVDGRSALHHAAFAGNIEVVKALLDAGGDSGGRDAAGRSPGDLAASAELRALLR